MSWKRFLGWGAAAGLAVALIWASYQVTSRYQQKLLRVEFEQMAYKHARSIETLTLAYTGALYDLLAHFKEQPQPVCEKCFYDYLESAKYPQRHIGLSIVSYGVLERRENIAQLERKVRALRDGAASPYASFEVTPKTDFPYYLVNVYDWPRLVDSKELFRGYNMFADPARRERALASMLKGGITSSGMLVPHYEKEGLVPFRIYSQSGGIESIRPPVLSIGMSISIRKTLAQLPSAAFRIRVVDVENEKTLPQRSQLFDTAMAMPAQLQEQDASSGFFYPVTISVGPRNWRMEYYDLRPMPVTVRVLPVMAAMLMGLLLLLLGWGYFTLQRQRRSDQSFARLTAEKLQEESRHKLELQRSLEHMGRLHVVGELSAGLAHELRQPLAAISTNNQACLRLLEKPEPPKDILQESMRQCAQAAQRAGEIIRQWGRFSSQKMEMAPICLVEAIDSALSLVAHEAQRNRIEIIRHVPAQPPLVQADAVLVMQVLINLVRNAIQAQQYTPLAERKILLKLQPQGDQVCLLVEDNGPGISPSVKPRLFEPFQTSKADGTGLGLAISHSIMHSFGGSLACEDATELNGACFRLTFVQVVTVNHE